MLNTKGINIKVSHYKVNILFAIIWEMSSKFVTGGMAFSLQTKVNVIMSALKIIFLVVNIEIFSKLTKFSVSADSVSQRATSKFSLVRTWRLELKTIENLYETWLMLSFFWLGTSCVSVKHITSQFTNAFPANICWSPNRLKDAFKTT